MARYNSRWSWWRTFAAVAALATGVLAEDVLKTTGFATCGGDASVKIETLSIVYDNDKRLLTFDIAGQSSKTQNVTASLDVSAYGNSIFSKNFNPCDEAYYVDSLCPLPVGVFSAKGSQEIPAQFASMVPDIAFQIPDIVAEAVLKLKALDGQATISCIQAEVTNGKSVNQPAVSYAAAGMAGAALVMSGVSAMGGSAAGAAGPASPGFVEVASLFQGMAINGMLSVNYPPIYRNFAKNFAFATGLVSWDSLLRSIDSFRANTGGNLTTDSVDYLRSTTLVFSDGSIKSPDQPTPAKRALKFAATLVSREVNASMTSGVPAGGEGGEGGDDESSESIHKAMSGIQAFAAELSVPKSDIFMTALLIVALVIVAIVFGVLLIKAILETWALFGSFPQSLTGFRKHYWNSIARTVTSLILLLYGVWVLYCVFQFTLGDSWAAKILAAVSLALFTGILAFFSWKIWRTVQRLKALDGDASKLFEDKVLWVKYSMFYESYRKSHWWIFIPTIVYLLVKGSVMALGDGHGMVQSILITVIEAAMLLLLVWSRPYECRNKNILSIAIQTVRFLSVALIFVFVEEFGVAKTTQTVTGVILIAIQGGLTATLAILIAWNVIASFCQMNPHRKRRKEMEKIHDMDDLTPLDARNSLLLLGGGHAKVDLEKSMYASSTNGSEKAPSKSSYYQMPDDSAPAYSSHQHQHQHQHQQDHHHEANDYFNDQPGRGSLPRALTPGAPMQMYAPPPGPQAAGVDEAHYDAGHQMAQGMHVGEQEYGTAPAYGYSNAGYRGV